MTESRADRERGAGRRPRAFVTLCSLLIAAAGWGGGAWAASALAGEAQPGPRAAVRVLSAPASDIRAGVVRLPDPEVTAVRSRHRLQAIGSPAGPLRVRIAQPVRGPLRLALMRPGFAAHVAERLRWTITSPAGQRRSVDGAIADPGFPAHEWVAGDLAVALGVPGFSGAWCDRFDIADAASGEWTVEVEGLPAQSLAAVVSLDASPWEVRARWESLLLRTGEPARLVLEADAPIVAVHGRFGPRDPVAGGLLDGAMIAETDPRSGLISGVTVVPAMAGEHVAQLEVVLRSEDGSRTERTLELLVDVAGAGRIQGSAELLRPGPDRSLAGIRLPLDGSPTDGVVLACAELWSVGPSNAGGGAAERPVAWLAQLAEVVPAEGGRPATVELRFEPGWLTSPAARGGTLELREVRLHERSRWALLDRVDRIGLGVHVAEEGAPGEGKASEAVFQPDLATLLGRPGAQTVPLLVEDAVGAGAAGPADDSAAPGSHALLLVHGYCSDGSTFPPAAFTGPVGVFLDPNQAKSNDTFAQTLLAFGAQFKSYGVVAHSQGGSASLHLYTFYWSGLDWAGPGRLIQSVGTPYQGTPLAGQLAVLGQLLGISCGSVTDLTPAGAAVWLSTIPTWARQKVWYWTTSVLDVPFQWDACSFLSDFFLTDPDDGVVEKFRGQLPGANNMGHKQGWCHVDGMNNPPQYDDPARNADMNGAAAR